MKKTRSIITLILCLCMLFSIVGCGSGDEYEIIESEIVITSEVPVSSTESKVESQVESQVESKDDSKVESQVESKDESKVESGVESNSTNSDAQPSVVVGGDKNNAFLNSLKGFEINIYTQRAEIPTRGTAAGDRYYAILAKVAKNMDVTSILKLPEWMVYNNLYLPVNL